jgi:hypothetical protein
MSETEPNTKNCHGCKHDHETEHICCGDHPEQCHACQEERQNWALGFGIVLIIMLIVGLILT